MAYMIDWDSNPISTIPSTGISVTQFLYVNNYVYACTYKGILYKSYDCVTWTQTNSALPNSLYSYCYTHDGTNFICVTMEGKVYSSNGTSAWSLVSEPSAIVLPGISNSSRWNSACYGNGIYVIGSYSTAAYGGCVVSSSTDLINWSTPISIETDSSFVYDIKYINNQFYLKASGKFYTSIDGTSWTQITNIATGTQILYIQDKFISTVISQYSASKISSDCINWTSLQDSKPVEASRAIYNPNVDRIVIANNSATIDLYAGKLQPVELKAYNNNDSVTYYAWEHNTSLCYTLSETPALHSQLYINDGLGNIVTILPDNELVEYDDVSTPHRIGISYDDGDPTYYNRDPEHDVIVYNGISKIYTENTSLTAGQMLYNNNGTNIGSISSVSDNNPVVTTYQFTFTLGNGVTNVQIYDNVYTTGDTVNLIVGTTVYLKFVTTGGDSTYTVGVNSYNTARANYIPMQVNANNVYFPTIYNFYHSGGTFSLSVAFTWSNTFK